MSEENKSDGTDMSETNTNQNNHTSRSQLDNDVVTPPTLVSSDVENHKEQSREAMDLQVSQASPVEAETDQVSKSNTSNECTETNIEGNSINTPDTDSKNDVSDNNESTSKVTNDASENDQKQPVTDTDGAKAKDNGDSSTHEALGEATGNAMKASSPGDSIYHIKWVYFKKKLVPIITQNENGPCPLLAILNVLLLQARVKIPAKSDIVTANQLMTYLGDCVLENVPTNSDEGMAASARLNFEQNMQDAMAVMYKLQTGMDVNVKFTGVKDFEYTPECIIFDLLQISLYHGWLVDPQNRDEVTSVGTCSYNQLVEKIIIEKTSDQPEVVSQALVAEQFLENSASQLTYHGLSELCSQLKDDELVVLFRNNHFTTLYRHNSELFQLVTDQGFLQESNVVWETLCNVEGDGHFVDSEFRTYTKPEPVFNPVENPDSHLNPDEQIEQDYMVALSMQQEQADHMAWAQVDPQQPMPQISDLELARSLQEEERRAAMAEQERNPRPPAQGAPRGASSNGGNTSQRQPQRADSRESSKKSDCCIL